MVCRSEKWVGLETWLTVKYCFFITRGFLALWSDGTLRFEMAVASKKINHVTVNPQIDCDLM